MDKSKEVAGYLLFDPKERVQEYIVGGTTDDFNKAVEAGFVFLVEYIDGSRQTIDPSEIDFSLIAHGESINIVQQEVFVPLMESLVDVVETIAGNTPTPMNINSISSKNSNNLTDKLNKLRSLTDDMLDRYKPNIEGGENGNNS